MNGGDERGAFPVLSKAWMKMRFFCPIPGWNRKMSRVMNEGERQARFLPLFLKHQNDLQAVIRSFVRDRAAADDVFQETALVLWKKFETYDPSRPFGAWARGVAVRKVLQRFDRNRREPVSLSPETIEAVIAAEPDGCDEVCAPDQRDALRHCMRLLPEKSGRLVKMRYEQGLSLQAMADAIASTLDAVNKALSRIRVELKKCIDRRLAELS